jgi:hypothetical protein
MNEISTPAAPNATCSRIDRNTIANCVFVNAGAQSHDGPHIFVTGRETLVVRVAALNLGGRAVINDFQIGGADRHGVDANQNLGARRRGNRFVFKRQLTGIAKHPGLHGRGNWIILIYFHVFRHRHYENLRIQVCFRLTGPNRAVPAGCP